MQRLERKIAEMKTGDHACLIFDSVEQQMSALVPFVRDGLTRKEAVLYIAPKEGIDLVTAQLNSNGINVKKEVKSGALIFAGNNLETPNFIPEEMISVLNVQVNNAMSKGFKGFRATGDMSWTLTAECGCDRLLEYEGLLNGTFPQHLTGLCQYSRSKFNPSIIHDVIRTHPVIIYRDQICRNLYCEGHEAFNGEKPNDHGVSWMLDNLTRYNNVEENLRHMMRMRDEFLSIASHELRTPLTAMKLQNQSRMIDLRKGKKLSETQWQKFINANGISIETLARIIESILDATSISKGRLEIDPKKMDLVHLTRATVEVFKKNYPSIKFEFKAPKAVSGRWDAERLQQVLNNLISNAIKYGEGKGISISIENDGAEAKLIVKDSGMGIAVEDQERIFEIYERAVSFTRIAGFGLGLYICKQIAECHRGSISVESELGKGSVFTVTLPKI